MNSLSRLPEAGTSSVRKVVVNLPLLLSILGVVVMATTNALVVEYQQESNLLRLLHYPMLFLLLLIVCYTLFEIVQQGLIARRNQDVAHAVSVTALFGGVLLGPLVLALTVHDANSLRLAGATVLLSLFSLVALFVAILREEPEPQPVYSDPPVLGPPRRLSTPAAPVPRLPSGSTAKLPPLFEDDPLYSVPRPGRASFLSAVKGNDVPGASEDACAVSADETRMALCDGASGSSLPRAWAALLAQHWVREPLYTLDGNTLSKWLYEPRQRWFAWVQEVWQPSLDQRNELVGNRPLSPDRVRKLLEKGAASTFLGVAIEPQARTLRYVALGDTCLFVFRYDKALHGWKLRFSRPLENSASFGDRPPLLSSKLEDNAAAILPYFQYKEVSFKDGDILLMATDALAQWILGQIEQGQSEWVQLLTLRDQPSFASFIDRQRYHSQIQDDDTTLLVVTL